MRITNENFVQVKGDGDIAAGSSVTISIRNNASDVLLATTGAVSISGTIGDISVYFTVGSNGLTIIPEGVETITITETSTTSGASYAFYYRGGV